jgi:hypothetical protein
VEVQETIRGLKVGKALCPNGLQNRALKHLPQRVICLLVGLLNAALIAQYLLVVWKRQRDFHPEIREGSVVSAY